jgi:hypothetical protein
MKNGYLPDRGLGVEKGSFGESFFYIGNYNFKTVFRCFEVYAFVLEFMHLFRILCFANKKNGAERDHSTVTDFAKFRGLSTSVPRASAV